jgi:hypothetical protein
MSISIVTKCRHCPFNYDNYSCVLGLQFQDDDDQDGIPDWCPLRKNGIIVLLKEYPYFGIKKPAAFTSKEWKKRMEDLL